MRQHAGETMPLSSSLGLEFFCFQKPTCFTQYQCLVLSCTWILLSFHLYSSIRNAVLNVSVLNIYLYVRKHLFIFHRSWALKAWCPDFHFIMYVCLEFEEPRVIDLWDMAKSANFTEKELESFRVSRIPVTSLAESYFAT